MNDPIIQPGITLSLADLIALQRFVKRHTYPMKGKKMQSGNHLSKWRGRGMDFAETRHYQAGDEIRHMEWKVTARTGRPHIKVFEEEKERPVVILVDFNPSMYFGTKRAFKSVIAAELAGLIAWTVIKEGDRLGGYFYTGNQYQILHPKARNAGLLPFLEQLSNYTQNYERNKKGSPYLLSEALHHLRRINRKGSTIVLISDFYHLDDLAKQHLSLLHAHNNILAYPIFDALESEPPQPGLYPINANKETWFLNTRQSKMAAAYQDWCQQRKNTLAALFAKMNIDYNPVHSQDFLPGLVHKTFPGRKSV